MGAITNKITKPIKMPHIKTNKMLHVGGIRLSILAKISVVILEKRMSTKEIIEIITLKNKYFFAFLLFLINFEKK